MHSQTDTQILVTKIESGLNKAAIPVGNFCQAAKINRATWQRWKSGKHSPHPSMVPGIVGAYEALVAKAERGAAA